MKDAGLTTDIFHFFLSISNLIKKLMKMILVILKHFKIITYSRSSE